MGSSSFKNWKFSTLSKVHFFQIDIRAPDGFAQSVPLITAFCSLQVTDLLETDQGESIVLVSKQFCPESHTYRQSSAEGLDESCLLETSVAGYFFHRIEYTLLQSLSTNMHRQQSLHHLDNGPWIPEWMDPSLSHDSARTMILTSHRTQWKTEQIETDWKHQYKGAKSTVCIVIKY